MHIQHVITISFIFLGLNNSAYSINHICDENSHFESELCGNGTCNHEICETSHNCSKDCGLPSPPPCIPDTCNNCAQPLDNVDLDQDSIPDLLEHQLVYKFFPDVELQGWKDDVKESYFFNKFSTPYTVSPIKGGGCDEDFECLELKISITFFNDTGDIVGIGDHRGDAEMYMVILQRDSFWSQAKSQPDSWKMVRDFTSAHWKQNPFDSSRMKTYSPAKSKRVRIYSSERKHGLYHSRSACNKGAFWSDDCPNTNAYNLRNYLGGHLQNIGSRNNHSRMDTTISSLNKCGSYDIWNGGNFDGDPFLAYFRWSVNWKLEHLPSGPPLGRSQEAALILSIL